MKITKTDIEKIFSKRIKNILISLEDANIENQYLKKRIKAEMWTVCREVLCFLGLKEIAIDTYFFNNKNTPLSDKEYYRLKFKD